LSARPIGDRCRAHGAPAVLAVRLGARHRHQGVLGYGDTLHSCSCELFEEPGLWFQGFDVDAFSTASADVDGSELAALDTLQHGLARDAEPTDGFAHGEE